MLRDLSLTGGTGAKAANSIPASLFINAVIDRVLTSAMIAWT
jgi:hypothetical protein